MPRPIGVVSPPTGVGAFITGASQSMPALLQGDCVGAAMGLDSGAYPSDGTRLIIDDWLPNSRVVMPELVACCTCTRDIDAVGLRKPASDAVVDACDIGVSPKSISDWLVLGKMLAGVT